MSTEYKITIGLEIHAELKTKSKMWCGCANDPYNAAPNTLICPVCMAEPGTLPVANLEAIRKVVQVGLALGADIADFTEFDRKNYFYPDIPKGYQISQYKFPIVSGGNLSGVDITRVHLEEDTAKSLHDQGPFTLVDFNRAGVPLMELVTEACIHSAEQAGRFGRELQMILRALDASDANMEMGQMRVEVNFSVSKDPNKLGTKVEIKNLNSFKTVEKCIEYEYKRHTELLDSGRGAEIVQETRGWDENKQVTFSQRMKENSHDYRYFPDPDLPKLYLHSMFDLEQMKKDLPELPNQKRSRLAAIGIKSETIEVLLSETEISAYFDKVSHNQKTDFVVLAANYLTSDILGLLRKEATYKLPSIENYVTLVEMALSGELSSRAVKDMLPILLENDIDPRTYAEQNNLIQKNDVDALGAIVNSVIAANPTQWAEYVAGNDKLLMFFVGQSMKESKGSGNPGLFQDIIASKK
jgi:aspartyl-tRNA(Asn)/glutamyl-tRNA(Gln) amidotransferase subunit B